MDKPSNQNDTTKTTLGKEISERIELILDLKGLSKTKFAKQVGISTGNLGDWKRGRSTPGAQSLIAISQYLEVSLDWLLLGRSEGSSEGSGQSQLLSQLEQLGYSELTKEEKEFIREYLAFSKHRKRKDPTED